MYLYSHCPSACDQFLLHCGKVFIQPEPTLTFVCLMYAADKQRGWKGNFLSEGNQKASSLQGVSVCKLTDTSKSMLHQGSPRPSLDTRTLKTVVSFADVHQLQFPWPVPILFLNIIIEKQLINLNFIWKKKIKLIYWGLGCFGSNKLVNFFSNC